MSDETAGPECFDELERLAEEARGSREKWAEFEKRGQRAYRWLVRRERESGRREDALRMRLREIERRANDWVAREIAREEEKERDRLYRLFLSSLADIVADAKRRAKRRESLRKRCESLEGKIEASALDAARREKLLKACAFIHDRFHLGWGPVSDAQANAAYLDAWERGLLFKGAKLAEEGWRKMGRESGRFRDYGRGSGIVRQADDGLSPLHPELPENWHHCFLRGSLDFEKGII